MGASDFPTKKDVLRHWRAQEPSVFRKPYTRDKGLSIVNSVEEVRQVLEMEMSGKPVELYKSRSPATDYVDPMAKAQSLLQAHYQKGLSKEEFQQCIVTPQDQLMYLIIHGDMSDNQRASNIHKLAKLLHDAQKAQEERLHREREIELKRQTNMLRGEKLLMEMQVQRKRDAKEKGE